MISIHKSARPLYRLRIGNREVVGPSASGLEEYYDRVDHPCPPIRFKEVSPEIAGLREKEKGNWKLMTVDEKKKLYRTSFCQTFAEIEAPTCQAKKTVFPPLPHQLSDEGKKKYVRWYIDSRADPLDGGISSKWDYEKNQWKEKPYLLMKDK